MRPRPASKPLRFLLSQVDKPESFKLTESVIDNSQQTASIEENRLFKSRKQRHSACPNGVRVYKVLVYCESSVVFDCGPRKFKQQRAQELDRQLKPPVCYRGFIPLCSGEYSNNQSVEERINVIVDFTT